MQTAFVTSISGAFTQIPSGLTSKSQPRCIPSQRHGSTSTTKTATKLNMMIPGLGFIPTIPVSLPTPTNLSMEQVHQSMQAVQDNINLMHAYMLLAASEGDVASQATDAVIKADPSWFDKFVGIVEGMITGMHNGLSAAGVSANAWGIAIIGFTVLVKALTFPLNYKQMASTIKMQALQPRMKQIQVQYRDNPQVMNQMIAELYQKEEVNPLAGCLPVLAQLPIWIALYRAVLNLANENMLNEGFLWLPSLQGPVASSAEGMKWLMPFVDGAPPIGWHDAACYLVLPIVLVLSQVWSQRVLTPPSDDPQMKQTQQILQFMPLLIGWFSLNVPSALGVYWVINNLLSTGQTILIRKQLGYSPPAMSVSKAGNGADSVIDVKVEEKPEGFSAGSSRGSSAGSSKTSPKKKKR